LVVGPSAQLAKYAEGQGKVIPLRLPIVIASTFPSQTIIEHWCLIRTRNV
jgi:hypothetical protein